MTLKLTDRIVAAGVTGLATQFEARRFAPTDVVDCYLDRIAHHDASPWPFMRVDRRGARCAARVSKLRWIHGMPLSALDGVPIAIQSNIAVRGLPWTDVNNAASPCFSPTDAEYVARLRAAGAIVLGTLSIDDGASAGLGASGRAPDIAGRAHSTGSSPGGPAAAVAAGLCAAALGIDAKGSVRLTAAACGVVACCLEPGRAKLHGVSPRSRMFDNVGVVARGVEDARCIVAAAAGRAAPYERRFG